ncbi:histidine--tRNA ligase [Paludibacter jiangxiensis]|uniref:Histidine--tRNA ligase n=1 Tax=Paludibacter jiangxiensis TaxID=681398 RepID=A0A170ZL81_9BACT|nr:histidine--tRNA ligase [Paludibacter jiangxiensis]GAT62783.1 histidyl-tRNA synthetase [Paludibacter jiangxiensis]
MQKPSIPKGTRDFSPEEMANRNYIFNTIKSVFQLYGFRQIETPAQENLSTLMGKYGEEGDKLLFKILNSGDFAGGVADEEWAAKNSVKLTSKISEKGLRYDLTVPFARYVVQHRDQITFPFKRYQIQPVWRADRPQKGRYREFYQCDADVVGSNSLVNEAELLQMIDEVFHRLSINVTIKLNNRKILAGIAEIIGQSDKIVDITVAIDKLDKIGLDNVNAELIEKGIPQNAIDRLQPVLLLQGSNADKLTTLKTVLAASETGLKGVEELETIFDLVSLTQVATTIELDLTLARGLNYYTGAIIEVKANDVQIGSISGGGRYDNLTGVFGMDGVSGVGISFGADRIYDVLNQLNGFPAMSEENTRLLFINFGDKEQRFCLPLLKAVRAAGINAEIFPEAAKIKKQMSYADSKKIPFVAIVGENEINANAIMLKNMTSGEQQLVPVDELVDKMNAQ